MSESKTFRIALLKAYFDTGYGITSYFKTFLAVLGVWGAFNHVNFWLLFTVGVGYAVFCFFFGYFWFWSGMKEAEQEVSNRFNKFVHEVRQSKIIKKV